MMKMLFTRFEQSENSDQGVGIEIDMVEQQFDPFDLDWRNHYYVWKHNDKHRQNRRLLNVDRD